MWLFVGRKKSRRMCPRTIARDRGLMCSGGNRTASTSEQGCGRVGRVEKESSITLRVLFNKSLLQLSSLKNRTGQGRTGNKQHDGISNCQPLASAHKAAKWKGAFSLHAPRRIVLGIAVKDMACLCGLRSAVCGSGLADPCLAASPVPNRGSTRKLDDDYHMKAPSLCNLVSSFVPVSPISILSQDALLPPPLSLPWPVCSVDSPQAASARLGGCTPRFRSGPTPLPGLFPPPSQQLSVACLCNVSGT